MNPICRQPAWELAEHLKRKEISALELMEETLARIEKTNPALNAIIALRADEALKEARTITDMMASGKAVGPLAGIPLGVKDLEDTEGMVTSYGSLPFKRNRAAQDSIQVARLKAAGAIVIGKTNTPEFGFTGFTKNRLHGVTRNPWNLERTPGGSSGGSAAAIAGCQVPLCTGSDAGGSIRIPACYSGCFGMKPTFGRIPIGPQPFVSYSSLVTVGPITRSVIDAALYMDCTTGYHPADPYSLPKPRQPYLQTIDQLPDKLRIAFSRDLGYGRVQKAVMDCVLAGVKAFEDMGHAVEAWDDALPDIGDAWSHLVCTDIYAQLRHLSTEDRNEIGRTLMAAVDGARALSVETLTSIQVLRAELNARLEEFFSSYDLLLTPTMPTEAFAAGGPPPATIDGHEVPLMGVVAFTYPFNFSGHPAASVPAGLTSAGLPAGLQIIGPRHRDDLVLQAARAYEMARPWVGYWPDI